MRLVWTPRGIRGRTRQGKQDRDFVRVSIRGYQRGYEAELEDDTEVVNIVKARGEDKRREVKPRGRNSL
jgi:hypothetical protein